MTFINKKPLIYFCDLTHTTITVAADCTPLGIGYVSAYAKKKFPNKFEMRIFKYPHKFFDAVDKRIPDILCCSYFPWNKQLSLRAAEYVLEKNPNCVVVFGGSSFPNDEKNQALFLKNNKIIDVFIPPDGEVPFSLFLDLYFKIGRNKDKIKEKKIPGCFFYDHKNNKFLTGGLLTRVEDINVFPSPILDGMMDEFLTDINMSPMIQTTRGCPNSCAFCWGGNKYNSLIKHFDIVRVKKELEYIAQKVKTLPISDIIFADSNFGLYDQDIIIVEYLIELQRLYGYPKVFNAPMGRYKRDKLVETLKKLKGVTHCFAVQSTNPEIVKNVNRVPVDLDKLKKDVISVHNNQSFVWSEIIAGLPYETKKTHMTTIRNLLDIGIDKVCPFTLMLLDGTKLNNEEAYKKYKYLIKYRLLPRDFGIYRGKKCFEIEKVIVGTNTYTFEEYLYFRNFHGLLAIFMNDGIYLELINYLKSKINFFDWLVELYDDLRERRSEAGSMFKEYSDRARNEIFDSEDQLIDFYSKNYDKLINCQVGENLILKYSTLGCTINFKKWLNYFFDMAEKSLLCNSNQDKKEMLSELKDIKQLAYAKLADIFIEGDPLKKIKCNFNHDILKWKKDGYVKSLSDYKFINPKEVWFELSDNQIKLVNEMFTRYLGKGGYEKAIMRIPLLNFVRKPIILEEQ